MPLKSLKDLTVKDFISTDILTVDAFPFMPSGLLKKHSGGDPTAGTDRLMQDYNNDWREADRFVERFSQKQKNSLGWIMAGLIGGIGNLAVNLAFSYPVAGGNLWLMILVLIIVSSIIVFYLFFLPKVTITFRFLPKYLNFPAGYEQYVPKG
jgi:hypothetical protein